MRKVCADTLPDMFDIRDARYPQGRVGRGFRTAGWSIGRGGQNKEGRQEYEGDAEGKGTLLRQEVSK